MYQTNTSKNEEVNIEFVETKWTMTCGDQQKTTTVLVSLSQGKSSHDIFKEMLRPSEIIFPPLKSHMFCIGESFHFDTCMINVLSEKQSIIFKFLS